MRDHNVSSNVKCIHTILQTSTAISHRLFEFRFSQAQNSDFHVMLSRFILAQLCICVSLIVAALHQTLKIAFCQTERQKQDLIVALIRRQREKWVDE